MSEEKKKHHKPNEHEQPQKPVHEPEKQPETIPQNDPATTDDPALDDGEGGDRPPTGPKTP